MGAGHDRVAHELAARMSGSGTRCQVIDVLDLLPLRFGHGLRRSYAWALGNAPSAYAMVYRIFFTSPRARAIAPLTSLAASRLEDLVRLRDPVALVSTFHLGAQIAGHLRAHGRLPVASHVLITDFAVHPLWLHPGNDAYLCPTPAVARAAGAATGRPAWCHAPVVHASFRQRPAPPVRDRPGVTGTPDGTGTPGGTDTPRDTGTPGGTGTPSGTNTPGVMGTPGGGAERVILVAAGSWGVGRVDETARTLAASGRYRPVVLCGRNERLRERLGRETACVALGWRDDMAELMATGHALVDNAAGLTAQEAIAAGVPVIGHRPIPGHGLAGVRAMAKAGLSVYAPDEAALLATLDRLADPSERHRQVARAAAVFDLPSAETVLNALLT